MPKKRIEAKQVGEKFRVIIPVDLRHVEGQETKWFTAQAKADLYARELNEKRDEIGRGFFSQPKADQGLLLKAIEQAGNAQAVWDAIQFHKRQKPSQITPLGKLIEMAVAVKERSGKSAHYVKCFKVTCEQFAARREDVPANEIHPKDVEAWVNSNPKWSQNTKSNYLRDIRTLFSFGLKNGHCVSNPAANVERPTVKDCSPAILTVPECERLMRSAQREDAALIPFLSLCLFGGLRPSEAFRIKPENIKENFVEVFGKRVRSKNRRLVTLNDTLRAWIDCGGDYGPANLRKRLKRIRLNTAVSDTGPVFPINWQQDCLRHSFVSYHFALYSQSTAREAGHSESVLFRHYRELVTQDDAKKFWSILPK